MENITLNLYQKIGDYFTGRCRKNILYTTSLIIFILIFFLSVRFKFTIDKETLYWVFSSIVQALLALVALMGVVSIFKLQNLNIEQDRIIKEAKNPQYTIFLNNEYSTIEKLMLAFDRYISTCKSKGTEITTYMLDIKKEIDSLLLSKRLTIDYAIKYTVYTFTVVIISLLPLMLVDQIYLLYLGYSFFYLIFLLTSYSLFLATKGFSHAINN